MRRAFAISLAILVVMFATRGVMAQDVQQDGNDHLLKILKERNILSEQEYQEIKGQLAADRNEVDQKLGSLDRSIADYLAKAGDVSGGNSSYVENQGVTFNSGDGMWSVFFGGLFQFGYFFSSIDDNGIKHCAGGFAVSENRFDFGGTIFDKNLKFYTQLQTTSYGMYYGDGYTTSGVGVLDAYVDYMFSEDVGLKAGLFKVPYGRQALTDQSDRAFGHINTIADYFRLGYQGRDYGLMVHGMYDMDGGKNGMAFEWAAGVWNGAGDNAAFDTTSFGGDSIMIPNLNGETNLMVGARAAFYPMGAIPYVEGDWTGSPDLKAGVGASIFYDTWQGSGSPSLTAYQFDAVGTWNGFFFLGEYFGQDYSNGSDESWCGWYLQAGWMVMPAQFEVLGRYGAINPPGTDDYSEWALGAAWYFSGHQLKLTGEVGQQTFKDGDTTDTWFFDLILQADW